MKKGTPKTEAIIGTGINKLNAAGKSLADAISTLNTMPKMAEDLSAEIAAKYDKIAALDVEYAEKLRQHEVDLKLQTQASEENFVTAYLTAKGHTSVEKNALAALESGISRLEQEHDANIKKEVAIATNSVKREYESQINLLKAEQKTQEAEKTAQIKQLNDQVVFLTSQVNEWKKQLDDERKASIERSKAGSIGAINVDSSGTRR